MQSFFESFLTPKETQIIPVSEDESEYTEGEFQDGTELSEDGTLSELSTNEIITKKTLAGGDELHHYEAPKPWTIRKPVYDKPLPLPMRTPKLGLDVSEKDGFSLQAPSPMGRRDSRSRSRSRSPSLGLEDRSEKHTQASVTEIKADDHHGVANEEGSGDHSESDQEDQLDREAHIKSLEVTTAANTEENISVKPVIVAESNHHIDSEECNEELIENEPVLRGESAILSSESTEVGIEAIDANITVAPRGKALSEISAENAEEESATLADESLQAGAHLEGESMKANQSDADSVESDMNRFNIEESTTEVQETAVESNASSKLVEGESEASVQDEAQAGDQSNEEPLDAAHTVVKPSVVEPNVAKIEDIQLEQNGPEEVGEPEVQQQEALIYEELEVAEKVSVQSDNASSTRVKDSTLNDGEDFNIMESGNEPSQAAFDDATEACAEISSSDRESSEMPQEAEISTMTNETKLEERVHVAENGLHVKDDADSSVVEPNEISSVVEGEPPVSLSPSVVTSENGSAGNKVESTGTQELDLAEQGFLHDSVPLVSNEKVVGDLAKIATVSASFHILQRVAHEIVLSREPPVKVGSKRGSLAGEITSQDSAIDMDVPKHPRIEHEYAPIVFTSGPAAEDMMVERMDQEALKDWPLEQAFEVDPLSVNSPIQWSTHSANGQNFEEEECATALISAEAEAVDSVESKKEDQSTGEADTEQPELCTQSAEKAQDIVNEEEIGQESLEKKDAELEHDQHKPGDNDNDIAIVSSIEPAVEEAEVTKEQAVAETAPLSISEKFTDLETIVASKGSEEAKNEREESTEEPPIAIVDDLGGPEQLPASQRGKSAETLKGDVTKLSGKTEIVKDPSTQELLPEKSAAEGADGEALSKSQKKKNKQKKKKKVKQQAAVEVEEAQEVEANHITTPPQVDNGEAIMNPKNEAAKVWSEEKYAEWIGEASKHDSNESEKAKTIPSIPLETGTAQMDTGLFLPDEAQVILQALDIARDIRGPTDQFGRAYDWTFWTRLVELIRQNPYSEEVQQLKPEIVDHVVGAKWSGIPEEVRGFLWMHLSDNHTPNMQIKSKPIRLGSFAANDMIGFDVNRTIPEEFADKKTNLKTVLESYAQADPVVGYTSGLAFVGGILVMELDDDKAALTLLDRLMYHYDLRRMYLLEMEGVRLREYQFEKLLERFRPELAQHLTEIGCPTELFASQWFVTMFGFRCPLAFVRQAYDLVILEGNQAIFKVALALVIGNEAELMEAKDKNQAMRVLSTDLLAKHGTDYKEWIRLAGGFDISSEYSSSLEAAFHEFQRQSQSLNATEELLMSRTESQRLALQLKKLTTQFERLLLERESMIRSGVEARLRIMDLLEENYRLAAALHEERAERARDMAVSEQEIQHLTALFEKRISDLEKQL